MTDPLALSRRTFIARAGAMIAGTAAAHSGALASSPALDVRRMGAAGDGVHDDSQAFAAAFARSAVVYAPGGTYLLDRMMIPSGRTLQTDGFATCFRQRPGVPSEMRLVNVVGSNVSIGDCCVEGNIAIDRGEQHHAIFVGATGETGDLSEVSIGNVRGSNIRGDVVYIGGRDGKTARNIGVGAVRGDNILRNIVSVVGGERIAIQQVAGTRVGLTHLDIEPEDYNGPVVGCTVGAVIGGFVQVAGTSPGSAARDVRIALLDLTGPVPRCDPPYPPGSKRRDALTIRNIIDLEIGRLIARGFRGQAIRQIWDPGALTDQTIHIHQAEIGNCATGPGAARALIVGSRRATRLTIDELTVSETKPGMNAVQDCKQARIGVVHGSLPRGGRLIADTGTLIDHLAERAGPAPLVFAGAGPQQA